MSERDEHETSGGTRPEEPSVEEETGSEDGTSENETVEEASFEGPEPGELYRIAWTFYLLMSIAGVIWVGSTRGLELSFFLDPATLVVDLLLGVVTAGVLVGAWQLLRRILLPMRRLETTMRKLVGDLDGAEIFALALISGFSEEFFFRGAVQSSWGWVWATLIFGLLHTGPGPIFRIWTAFALVAGLAFAGLVIYRDNLLAAIVAHFLVNWINLSALMSREDEGDEGEGGETAEDRGDAEGSPPESS